MTLSSNLDNKIPENTYQRDQLVCVKVQVHSLSEPAIEYNQDHRPQRS